MSADAPDKANRLESLLLNLVFAAISFGLLAIIGEATRTGPASAGWWTQPAFAPGVALALLALANGITLLRAVRALRAAPPSPGEWRDARAKVLGWLRPVEFLAYFAAYVVAVGWAGYFPATLVFVLWLMLRVGLGSWRWLLAGLGLVVALILIFRIGLGVWMPAPGLYDLVPDALRTILIRWF